MRPKKGSTVGQALVLHTADPGLIPGIQYGPPALPGVNS